MQSVELDDDSLRRFDPARESAVQADPTIAAQCRPDERDLAGGVDATLELLAAARRPLILIGHGLIASGAERRFRELAPRFGLPVTATWRALEVMGHDHPLFFGSPGLQAPRYANIITQGADFLLALGSRLDKPSAPGK